MKSQLKKSLYIGALTVGMATLVVSFQNCSRMGLAVDDVKKADVLSTTSALSGGSPSETEPGTNNGAGPGQNEPGVNNGAGPGQNEPGVNNGAGPGQNEPGGNSGNPPGQSEPGGNSGKPPGQGEPSGNAGFPPGQGEPSGNAGFPPGQSEGSGMLPIWRVCPVQGSEIGGDNGNAKTLAQTTDVKIVFTPLGKDTVFCEIDHVRDQVLAGKSIDVSSCPFVNGTSYNVYLVDQATTSNFRKSTVNETYEDPMNRTDVWVGGKGVQEFGNYGIWVIVAASNNNSYSQYCDEVGDPLVLQLNTKSPEPIALSSAANGVMFDLLGEKNLHRKVQTAWFTNANVAENYFLVLPDSSGAVNGIDDMFGDATVGPDGKFAKQGFASLAKYDANKDKMIDAQDAVFSKLRLWKDSNMDGIVQANELFTLDQKGVVSIDLRYDRRFAETDQFGNKTKYKSIVIMKDNSYGLVFDLWLKYISK